ncbi:MAG TPA: NYN domain-containing protein [Hyphomicrobiaceae bacterium]|nr:NYN domain-containing protein [Hyphomicrobiaceae bacterium]
MDVLEALLGEGKQVLFSRAPEALFFWVNLAILGVLIVVVLPGRLRKRRRRRQIAQLFAASSNASRGLRQDAELAAFARGIARLAEGFGGRLNELRADRIQLAKIYIDHSNFTKNWKRVINNDAHSIERDILWVKLPELLLAETRGWLAESRKEPPALVYRGTNMYGTLFEEEYFELLENMLRLERTAPEKLPLKIYFQKETVDRWRQENEAQRAELARLQNEFGFLVFTILRRTPRYDRLGSSNFTVGGIPIAPEKQLDTLVTTDLIADAMYDVYDIAFLISEDSDFCPAVEFVQEMRNKHVVHVGFGAHSNDLRSKCRLRIDLAGKDHLFRRMQAKPTGEAVAARAKTANGS